MTEQKLYRVEELYTNGWEPVATGLTKERATSKLSECLDQGIPPERLRAVREQ